MDKPNVMNPHIVVTGVNNESPYYEILYYDVDKKEWMCGYSSFCLDYVKDWLAHDLNIVSISHEFVPKIYGKWIYHDFDKSNNRLDYEKPFECSACKDRQGIMTWKFCPNCGAEMLKDDEEVVGNGNLFKAT